MMCVSVEGEVIYFQGDVTFRNVCLLSEKVSSQNGKNWHPQRVDPFAERI